MAFCLRFLKNIRFKKNEREKRVTGELFADEISEALVQIIKDVQRHFNRENMNSAITNR